MCRRRGRWPELAEWQNYTGLASGLLYLALGLFALTIRPRRAVTMAFGVFGLAYGAGFAWINLMFIMTGRQFFVPQLFMLMVAYGALFVLIMRSVSDKTWLWRPAVGAALAGTMSGLLVHLLFDADKNFTSTLSAVETSIQDAAIFLGIWALLSRRGRPAARDIRIVLAAVFLLAAFAAGSYAVFHLRRMATSPDAAEFFWSSVLLWGTWSVLLMVAAARETEPADRRTAWRFAWFVMALILLGALLMLDYDRHPGTHPLRGILRTIGFLVLSYAILRRSLLGIDVKARWTISKSTVAGIFIAVFFIASEGAQLLFGQENELVGLFAAGALVFAISPLQRVADQIAVKAVPVTADAVAPLLPTGQAAAAKDEGLYLRAVRLALRDRIVTPEEELDLIELAERLGIGARRAAELRLEATRADRQ